MIDDKASGRKTGADSPQGRLVISLLLALLLAYLAVASVDRAARRPIWTDEILTIAVTRLSSPGAIWSALADGADGNPPLFYLVQAAVSRAHADPHVGFRLASILSLVLAGLATFLFGARAAGPAAGALALAGLLMTPVYGLYAIEARPYTLLIACLAWAMVMWQDLERGWRVVIFGAMLSLATSLHHIGLICLVPFGLAEVARTVLTRRIRFGVWAALSVAVIPVLVTWPLLGSLKALYSAHYWSQAGGGFMLSAHDTNLGLPAQWAPALVSMLSGLLVLDVVRRARDPERSADRVAEGVLLLGFINLPVFIYVAARVGGGGLVPRYALPAVLGVSIALALSLVRRSRIHGVMALVFMVLVLSQRERDYWGGRGGPVSSGENADVATLNAWLRDTNDEQLPVVVSNGHAFVEMSYYGGTFDYLLDRASAVTYASSDSVEISLERVSRIFPLRTTPLAQFVDAHPRFLVFSKPGRWDWLPDKLESDGFLLKPLKVSRSGPARLLYLVQRP